MSRKTIIILFAIIAVSVPISVNAMLESWIGVDCTTLSSPGMIPICNDINDIDARLYNIEGIHHEIIDNNRTDSSAIVGTPYTVEGFTANVHFIDWTDKIKIQVLAPNQTKITEGVQPLTFTPDKNGRWVAQAFIIDDYFWSRTIEATDTASILYEEQ